VRVVGGQHQAHSAPAQGLEDGEATDALARGDRLGAGASRLAGESLCLAE
jgi:hypothetical protein